MFRPGLDWDHVSVRSIIGIKSTISGAERFIVVLISCVKDGKCQCLDPCTFLLQRIINNDVVAAAQRENFQVGAAIKDDIKVVIGEVPRVECEAPQLVHSCNSASFPLPSDGRPVLSHREPLQLRAGLAGSLVDIAATEVPTEHKHEVL